MTHLFAPLVVGCYSLGFSIFVFFLGFSFTKRDFFLALSYFSFALSVLVLGDFFQLLFFKDYFLNLYFLRFQHIGAVWLIFLFYYFVLQLLRRKRFDLPSRLFLSASLILTPFVFSSSFISPPSPGEVQGRAGWLYYPFLFLLVLSALFAWYLLLKEMKRERRRKERRVCAVYFIGSLLLFFCGMIDVGMMLRIIPYRLFHYTPVGIFSWLVVSGFALIAETKRLTVSIEETRRSLRDTVNELSEKRKEAITDRLTGLYNHAYFYDTLEREVKRATSLSLPLSLLFFDLDNFKEFNDRYGHLAGDRVLASVGEVLKKESRAGDIVCRYGGEEFAIILPATEEKRALGMAERIRRVIGRLMVEYKGNTYRSPTVTIGVSSLSSRRLTPADLVAEADRALYLGKLEGKNRVELFRKLE